MSDKENTKIEPDWKKFYDYKYWREEQRKQLTITSNIFFTFNVAIIAFIVNYLLKRKSEIINESVVLDLFLISIILFTCSVVLYIVLNILRLIDYRETSKWIHKEKSFSEIKKKTNCIGKFIWLLFYFEIGFSLLGFFIVLFSFYQIIFKL